MVNENKKTILHMDGDAFFVAVEVAKNPTLRGLPVVTGAERGMVTALSYEAKTLGVTRGMPTFQVRRNFPQVVILPGDYSAYVRYSRMMFNIVRRYADEIEEYSIDECFADMSGLDRTLKMSMREIAKRIQGEAWEELGLSVTIGLAPTKVLAKVASKRVKPRGLTEITLASAPRVLADTPIEAIWGVGPRMAVRMRTRGIHTAHDFVMQDEAWVRRNFSKPQEAMWLELRGITVYPVLGAKKNSYDSMQRTRSFTPATGDSKFLLQQLATHIEDVCRKARYYNLAPRRLMIYLRTKDFQSKVHITPLEVPTASPSMLHQYLEKNFHHVYKKGILYRSSGVTLLELTPTLHMQGNLFARDEDAVSKFASIHAHIDALEEKHGRPMVYLASSHRAHDALRGGKDDFEQMDRNLLFL